MREGLKGVDANLLEILHALLVDRNLTRAGERVGLSQPAVSAALKRLRKHYDDELLTRVGREFELTERARALLPRAARAVESAAQLLDRSQAFDPASTEKVFAVSLTEYAVTVLAEPLNAALARLAPRCSVVYDGIPPSRDDFETHMSCRDLVVAPLGFGFPGQRQPLFTDRFVCIVDRDNPFLRDGALRLDDLRVMPHAVAEFGPARGIEGRFETAAEDAGLREHPIQVQVTSILTLPYAIAGTDLCAFVPSRLARRFLSVLDLVVARTPLDDITVLEAVHWHPRRAADPAGVWLRGLLHDVAVGLEDDLP